MLSRPPFAFTRYSSSLVAAPAAANCGVTVSAGANNIDGAAVQLIPALAHDVHYLVFAFCGGATSAANCKILADLLIDPAGGSAWAELIADLVCGFTVLPVAGDSNFTQYYHFPIFIKAGSSIGVRARTSHTAARTCAALLHAYGEPSRPEAWWCGNKVESLGITAASSKGTDVTPGAAGAFGSWTNIGAVTSQRYGAVQLGIGGSDATALAIIYHWELGYASLKLPGSPTFHSNMNTSENMAMNGFNQLLPCDIPAGTQMQARGKPSGTGEIHDLAIYGVY